MKYATYFSAVLLGIYIDQNYKVPNIMETLRTVEKQFSKK